MGWRKLAQPPEAGPARVLRIIARMNVGGPALHVSLLSGRMDARRFSTLLAAGRVGPGETAADALVDRYGVRRATVARLGPALRPLDDLAALRNLVALGRAFQPHIVHTHTSKAGMLGRLAALAMPGRPIVLHTYHGHVLEGYFGPARSTAYRLMERRLARSTTRLISVSQAVVDDLVRLGVAPPERFTVIPLGLELDRFLAIGEPDPQDPVRSELGVAPGEVLLLWAGRLVPIKRLDVLLDAVAAARAAGAPVRLALAGHGPLRAELEQRARRLGIESAVHFAGHRSDMPALVAAADVGVLSSDNEGTPVALIEAAAGGRPLVSTEAGGVRDVVCDGAGRVVARGDAAALGAAIAELALDGALRRRMGAVARAHARETFRPDALVERMERLYGELLSRA